MMSFEERLLNTLYQMEQEGKLCILWSENMAEPRPTFEVSFWDVIPQDDMTMIDNPDFDPYEAKEFIDTICAGANSYTDDGELITAEYDDCIITFDFASTTLKNFWKKA